MENKLARKEYPHQQQQRVNKDTIHDKKQQQRNTGMLSVGPPAGGMHKNYPTKERPPGGILEGKQGRAEIKSKRMYAPRLSPALGCCACTITIIPRVIGEGGGSMEGGEFEGYDGVHLDGSSYVMGNTVNAGTYNDARTYFYLLLGLGLFKPSTSNSYYSIYIDKAYYHAIIQHTAFSV